MELIKDNWTEENVNEFITYLESFSRPEKIEWTRKIINTEMPVLAILSPRIKLITNEIAKGNFMSFLDLNINEYYENTCINGGLIMKIKDFNVMRERLKVYADIAENWATCDLLSFNVTDKNKEKWWELAKDFMTSEKPFVRRIGVDILFKFVADDNYIGKIYSVLNSFEDETEYYANMALAWLTAECFTKQRDKTLEFLKTNKLNDFAVNKAVSKCRDSFRVSKSDKEMLIKFKR